MRKFMRILPNPRSIYVRNACSIVPQEDFGDICLKNEPILEYKRCSDELNNLERSISKLEAQCEDIPIVIGGKDYRNDNCQFQIMPHRRQVNIAKFYHANKSLLHLAIKTATEAQKKWDRTPLKERIEIWENAANLIAGTYRTDLVAATMMGQAKTVFQAEIDAGAELADFIRMNPAYLKQAASYSPISEQDVTKNSLRLRGIEGFVAAISPFNFTAIGGNLAYTPALMGNAVLWKPSDCAILSNWLIFKIMREAGVPDGVVNFVPADGPTFGSVITNSPYLAGINFTGSLPTFRELWRLVGENIEHYNCFPRLVGECGGKNFHFVHPSADMETVVASTIRGAFEYGGQKCSACSVLYVPESKWECEIMASLLDKTCKLFIGDVTQYENFYSAVIDIKAYKRIVGYIDYARSTKTCKILVGGTHSALKGFFVDPTIILVTDPNDRLLNEEIFGPILSVYVYKDDDLKATMEMIADSRKYALTGAIFSQNKPFLKEALEAFKCAAGNFYVNDKSTGAVVGQQPFGGARLSGTNDKAGGPHYVLRWTTPQAVKEAFRPQPEIYYPYMEGKLRLCGQDFAAATN